MSRITIIILGIIAFTKASSDGSDKYIASVDAYQQTNTGQVPQFKDYEGTTDLSTCITICGCKSYPVAAFDNGTNSCYCGEKLTDPCKTDTCISIYNSDGFTISFASTTPSNVYVNEPFDVAAQSSDNVEKFGLLINERLAVYPSKLMPSVKIGMPGNYSMVVEANAFYGCPSEVQNFVVEVGSTSCSFITPSQFKSRVNTTFNMFLDLTGPDDLPLLIIRLFNGSTDNQIAEYSYTDPSASTYVEIGGNSETNRYQTYNLTFNENKRTAVIVSLNHLISSSGIVTGFSAHITKPGGIRFLILEPACEKTTSGSVKKMCYLSKKCEGVYNNCPQYFNTFYPSAATDIFYPDWIQFGPSNTNLPTNLVPRTIADIMFRVVYSFSVNATVLGHNDFDVPDSEQFSTSPGQFLAWMPDYSNSTPGDIAYNSIDSASQFQSIHYDEIFDAFFNETFDDNSAYLSPITISNTEHMISLYLEIPSTYLVEVSADNPDGTDFIAQAFVKDSDNNEKLICEGITSIVTDIRNLTLSTSDLSTSVLTDTVVVFNVSGFGIAKANYAVYWDEDIVKKTGVYDEIFNSSEFEHSFSKPGSYNVTVKAFTELSFKITNFTLNVICGLSTPSFFNTNEDPIKANEEINPVKKTDTEISIDVAFTGCGMITINYYLESDILQTNGSSFLWLSDSSIFVIRSNEFQTQAQNINVTVCATNNIEVHCLNDIGYVEEVIENFNLIVTTMETNVSGLLNISSKTKGTNKTYCIEWGDGNSTCTNGTYNVESIEHTYARPGNYTIFALAFNRVSRMNLTVQQEVQDRISGCKISANPTIFKEITYVTLGIDNGTGISLVLDWGNGRKNLINNFDISFNDSTSFPSSLLGFKGFASFKYLVKHDYNICLSLTNDISNDSCCVVAIVEDEIMELNISLVQEFQGTNKTDWIEENETLSLTSEHYIMAGRIVYLVNLGNETVFNTTNSVVNVSYTPWKLCYNYSVVATNPVSIASDWMNLCVQRPLYPINSTGFVHAPENSTEEMSIKFTFSVGNYFDCYFNFSDESENSISQVSYTDFVGPIGFIETKHKFKAGEYNVTLSCTNRLYDFFSSTVVLSQDPINKPYLEISALCYNDSIVSEVQLTTDPPGVMSAACNIYVKIDDQSGSSVNESGFLIINGKNKGSFFADNHTIEFKSKLWSGASVYSTDVCINTTNKVSTDLTCKSIKMVAPVLSVQVTVESGRHSVGVPIQFTANFPTPIPGDLCLEIDFNDNTPSQLYGGTNCKNALGLLKIPFILSYQYKKVGIYSVTFKASNQISSVTETTLIRVLDAPCSAPYIEITSSAANSEDALNDNQKAYFFKCKNTTFKHIMRRNCSRDFATLTKNIVLEYKVNNDTWLKVVDESLDKQYILVRKTLERYGVYRLTYIGQMVDNRSLELIDDTTSKKIGYFKIVPCPLRIVVDGGYEKTFQRGGEIIIDATQSYDPDDDKASIKADWFCGRSDAFEGVDVNSITEKISYPVVDLSKYTEEMFPSKGCFSNSESAALLNDKGLMSLKLVLISDYLWHFCYDLRLRIMKINDEFKRQSIRDITICLKSNDSFLVSVKCEQNCDDLVNPNSKLSLSSLVLNKGNGTQITYNWQVFRMLQGDISSTYEDITDELRAANKSTTGFDKRNFVLLPNSLNSTYRYKFRVNASCNSCEKLSGAGAEIKDVNSPPDVSKATCKISPPTGVAAQTDFIITCFGVEDEQLPLFYGFEFNCNDTWALLTISTSVSNVTSGKFKLPVGHNTFSTDANYCFLRVKVRDSYGVSSDYTPTLYVQVSDGSNNKRKKRSDEDLSIKMCDDLSTDYVLSSQSLTASYISILSEMKSSLSEKCKNSIEEKLVSIWVDTPDDANFVVHNILTDGNHTIALNALQNIVNTISILSATELTEISNHILSKTSLLGGKSTMEFALTLESKLCSAIALTLIIGEPAAKSSNPQSTISIEQIEPGPKVIGGFDLPDIGGEGGGAINSIGANRYSFDKASSNVKGPVKGLSLTNPDGSPKSVKNLPKPILLTLENTEKKIPMKNFTAYCELMRDIHRVDATVNSSIIVLNILPMDENFTGSFFLFMNKGTAPSLTDNQQNCTLPNLPPSDWDSLPQASQEYWEREKKWNCYFSEIELNRTAVGVWCVGVIYYNDSHPLAKALLPLSAAPSDDNCTAVRYYFQAYTRACLYWDKDIGTWNTDGCDTVENETNSYQTVCGCTHLTDFGGGGPIATAEPLDLGNLRKFDLKSNPTVFAVVMALFGVYLILLVWARKKDIRDFEKNKVIVLPENHHEDKYLYEIVVETGFKQECSTTADVMIVITGRNGESGPRRLYSPYRKCFQKAETDFFIMAVPACLGELSDITIWHNNAGVSPGWFLLKVQVRDMQTQKKVEFLCNQWFDVAEDDGMIIRTLQPSTHEEITEFKYLFFVTLRRNLYEGHIWLSLFTRPAQSSFTTCQRLATCMSLLMTSMIANAMFYKGDTGPPATSITMGPFTFSVNEVKTAFTVALIVVPTNLLIILLFKKAGPKIPKNSTKYELQEKEVNVVVASPVEQEMLNVKKYNSWVKFFRSILFPGGEDEEVDNKKPLPYWLIYIAYMLAFISSVVSAFFVIAYGFQFGKTKSDQWIVSMLFSFCYSVFLIQPFKVVVLSLIFSALLKVPSSNGRASSIINGRLKPLSEEEEEIEMTKVINKDSNKFSLPDERKLNEFRVARMKEKRIKIIIKEVLVHLSFVILVIVVAYSSADPSCFDLYNSVHQLCASNGILKDYVNGKITVDGEETDIPSGYDVATNEDWFTWTTNSVVGYLFPKGWYSDIPMDFPHGFVADSASSKVLAMARFRQLRVMRNSCTKHPVFKYLISECNAGYSYSSEEVEEYKAGWQPPLNQTERFRRRRGKRKALWKGLEDPWLYQTTSQLKNPFPFTGLFNTYTGSSYSVSIGPDRRTANRILKDLKQNFWVDRYTRALFTEINIYNANTNLLLIVTFLHEVLPTGGWNFYTNVQALRLYRYVGGLGNLVILFDVVFSAISFIGVFKSVRAIRKSSLKEYISNPWNLLHVVVTVNSICAIAFTLGRMLAVNAAVAEYTAEPEMFVSFQFVGQLEYLIIGCLGFVLFFTNLEFLRILRFNRLIALLSKSISIMSGPLLSFGLIFFVVFMAFVSFTTCIYVDKLEDFQSVPRSFVTMTTMFLGKISVSDYFNNAPVFGPLMFASYMLSIQMIMINLFVGLICDAFAEVSEQEAPDEEPSVFGFMIDRVKNINSGGGAPDPIYSEWKDDWEQMIDNLKSGCDNCTYLMRNMEAEELRQNKFFDQGDKIKRELLVAVLGLDFFTSEVEFCDGLTSLEKKLLNITPEDAKHFLLQAAVKRRIALQQELLDQHENGED